MSFARLTWLSKLSCLIFLTCKCLSNFPNATAYFIFMHRLCYSNRYRTRILYKLVFNVICDYLYSIIDFYLYTVRDGRLASLMCLSDGSTWRRLNGPLRYSRTLCWRPEYVLVSFLLALRLHFDDAASQLRQHAPWGSWLHKMLDILKLYRLH